MRGDGSLSRADIAGCKYHEARLSTTAWQLASGSDDAGGCASSIFVRTTRWAVWLKNTPKLFHKQQDHKLLR